MGTQIGGGTVDEMAPGELARRFEDVVREMRSMADRMLLKEVYEAHRVAHEARMATIEQDRTASEQERVASRLAADQERAAMRRLVYGLAGSFFVSTAVQIITILATRK